MKKKKNLVSFCPRLYMCEILRNDFLKTSIFNFYIPLALSQISKHFTEYYLQMDVDQDLIPPRSRSLPFQR
jgi:hypothetical protein